MLSRIAHAVDVAIREIPICDAKAERTASGNVMITSDLPMHRDLMVVHGQPGAPTRIRIVSRLGDLAVSFAVPDGNRDAEGALRCGTVDNETKAALDVLGHLSTVLHAACDARTAHRPRTMRHDAMTNAMTERLKAIGTLVLSQDEGGRRRAVVYAPTPWSILWDAERGAIEHSDLLWNRRSVVRLSVLSIDRNRNTWSIEIRAVNEETSLQDDAMGVLRILSNLPANARRRLG